MFAAVGCILDKKKKCDVEEPSWMVLQQAEHISTSAAHHLACFMLFVHINISNLSHFHFL